MRPNPVLRFVDAVNRGDIDAITACFHPDFEMIVPQHPARGFKGRDQEVKNMRYLLETHPDGRIEVLRMAEAPPEVWVENSFTAAALEMAAVVIYRIDEATDTIVSGRYYSERVDDAAGDIDQFMEDLGR